MGGKYSVTVPQAATRIECVGVELGTGAGGKGRKRVSPAGVGTGEERER